MVDCYEVNKCYLCPPTLLLPMSPAAQKSGLTKIRFITPDVAIAHVTNELSGLVNADGQRLPAQRELSLRVFVKDRGVWRITAFHNTALQP